MNAGKAFQEEGSLYAKGETVQREGVGRIQLPAAQSLGVDVETGRAQRLGMGRFCLKQSR